MKTKIQLPILVDAVSRIVRATQKNPQLPVLSCVLIEAKNSKVTLKATNLEISVSITLSADVEKEGIVAVPGNLLLSFIQGGRDGEVTLNLNNDIMEVSMKKGKAKIKTVPHDDFPEFPGVTNGKEMTFDGVGFIHALKSVVYAASPSMIRPELASVYITHAPNMLVMVATDSFRLAEKKLPLQTSVSFDPIMIPAKNINDILSILKEDSLTIIVGEHNIQFTVGETTIISRLTNGNFPDYTQILPKEFRTTSTLLTRDFTSALKRTAVFSDSFAKVTVTIDPKGKTCSLSSKNNDLGESSEDIEAALTGDPITLHFNYRYVNEVFQHISNDSIRLSFVGEGRPMLIEGIGDQTFLYLVMPMNR